MLARGADPVRTRVFANTVDVPAWIARAEGLTAKRAELRGELGLAESDVAVVSVARLGPEKGLDTLVEAVGRSGNPHLVLVLAGQGPERQSLARRAEEAGVRLLLLGNVSWERVAEVYATADAFALLSRRETWGVVVNEAAASGLPLLLSDQVGAAYDLLREGENGFRVPVDDTDAAAEALRTLASDAGIRRRFGERSREIVGEWSYESSADNFVAAVRDALRSR
jgi:glycosyltransferase involved in cell wall biosynthesis